MAKEAPRTDIILRVKYRVDDEAARRYLAILGQAWLKGLCLLTPTKKSQDAS